MASIHAKTAYHDTFPMPTTVPIGISDLDIVFLYFFLFLPSSLEGDNSPSSIGGGLGALVVESYSESQWCMSVKSKTRERKASIEEDRSEG